MDQRVTARIPISSIILDEDIYPRKGIDHRRVGMFAENIRDGFSFDPVDPLEVEAVPDMPGVYRLGLPQERIAKRVGQAREVICDHLGEMPVLAFSPNADLSHGFTAAQVAEKHGWTEPMVWYMGLDDKDDLQRFQELR